MPYSIAWNKETVCCTFSGAVSGEELATCNLSMYGDPRFDDIRFQLFDMLKVTHVSFERDDVKLVAAYDRAAAKVNPNVKCALVSTDHVALKLSEVYRHENIGSPWEAKAFRSREEACEWGRQP